MDTEPYSELQDFARDTGMNPEELRRGLNLSQAACVLGIGVSTLRSRALAGLIGCERDGRRWIFRFRDLQNYIMTGRQPVAQAVRKASGPRGRARSAAYGPRPQRWVLSNRRTGRSGQ